jgi:hypothetical protein
MIGMRRALVLALVLGAVGLAGEDRSGASTSASATSYSVSATMNARQVVTPANKPWTPPPSVADAHGSFTGTLRISAGSRMLRWQIRYAKVGTSRLQIADIHLGKPGRFGQVLVRLCAACKSGQSGTKKVGALAARAIISGNSWITVITGKYPNGVIRGQIKNRNG